MKKIMILFVLLTGFVAGGFSQSVYELSFKSANGDSISLSQYRGKKVLIMIVPLNLKDSVYHQLEAFRSRYGDSVAIVAIPSVEDGFVPGNKAAVSKLYNNKGFTLAEGMKTRRAAGAQQSPLMQWLTDVKKNRHFNNDAEGVGQKFFVSESGRLFAVMGSRTSLQSPIIDRIVRSDPK